MCTRRRIRAHGRHGTRTCTNRWHDSTVLSLSRLQFNPLLFAFPCFSGCQTLTWRWWRGLNWSLLKDRTVLADSTVLTDGMIRWDRFALKEGMALTDGWLIGCCCDFNVVMWYCGIVVLLYCCWLVGWLVGWRDFYGRGDEIFPRLNLKLLCLKKSRLLRGFGIVGFHNCKRTTTKRVDDKTAI